VSRKSISVEERARDTLYDFLLALHRRPLAQFLKLYFSDGVPKPLAEVADLKVNTEVPTNLGSRVDLLITGDGALLFVEVKVDAVEQVGQYEKYKHYFESGGGYTVYAGGLVNRLRKPGKKDNAPFVAALGVRRVYWSQVLSTLETEFGNTREFALFRSRLMSISPHIGTYSSDDTIQTERVERDPGLLVNRNDILCSFYSDLRPRLSCFVTALQVAPCPQGH
jgi:hypothetical protein